MDLHRTEVAATERVVSDTKKTAPTLYKPHVKVQKSLVSLPETKYWGLRVLALCLLMLANIRLMIENTLRYGWITNYSLLGLMVAPSRWPSLLIGIGLNVFVIFAVLIEKMASTVGNTATWILHTLNITVLILLPWYLIAQLHVMFASGVVVCMMVVIVAMKLVSWAQVNSHLRNVACKYGDKSYPGNVNFQEIYYFMFVPTLCYQTKYPRTDSINWKYLILKIFEVIVLSLVQFTMGGQYIYPIVEKSLAPLDKGNFVSVLERILKLSLPNLYVWLLGFYVFFHDYLNILAEIARFGDRQFYKDWWNSTDLGTYWRTWNSPVHNWMLRHVYIPCSKMGMSRIVCTLLCFFISAVFHEYILSVPFGHLKLWAFWGMMGQVPLVWLTRGFSKSNPVMGNVIFWVSIAIGQPFLVVMYYRDYMKTHYNTT